MLKRHKFAMPQIQDFHINIFKDYWPDCVNNYARKMIFKDYKFSWQARYAQTLHPSNLYKYGIQVTHIISKLQLHALYDNRHYLLLCPHRL